MYSLFKDNYCLQIFHFNVKTSFCYMVQQGVLPICGARVRVLLHTTQKRLNKYLKLGFSFLRFRKPNCIVFFSKTILIRTTDLLILKPKPYPLEVYSITTSDIFQWKQLYVNSKVHNNLHKLSNQFCFFDEPFSVQPNL